MTKRGIKLSWSYIHDITAYFHNYYCVKPSFSASKVRFNERLLLFWTLTCDCERKPAFLLFPRLSSSCQMKTKWPNVAQRAPTPPES